MSFPTTEWSVVLSAAKEPTDRSRAALSRLCQAYWPPLYTYCRRRGLSADDACDSVQAYFAELIERQTLGGVERDLGRFRAFLLHTLKAFLINEYHHRTAQKRGGTTHPVELDSEQAEHRYDAQLADRHTPESAFEHQWAKTVVSRTLDQMSLEAKHRGRQEEFEHLRHFLTDGAQRGSYPEVARELGVEEGALRVRIHRLRKRFGELLRETIGQTVSDPAEIDDEIRHLFASLAS